MIIEPRSRPVGTVSVHRLLPWRERRSVGPFVFLDVMGPMSFEPDTGLDVDAHPHIGLSTLTYLLEGRLRHRDSMGVVQDVTPGAVNWMTAGSGVTHTERSVAEDRVGGPRLFGVQTWVALPDGAEDAAPRFDHADAADVPRLEEPGVAVHLAAGTGWGLSAPIVGSSPLILAEVVVEDGATDPGSDHSELAVLSLAGDIEVGGHRLAEGSLVVLDNTASSAQRIISGRGRAVVIGGEPVGRRHIWWNFVHSDPARIEDAKNRWLAQEFPLVPGDDQPFVPLPR